MTATQPSAVEQIAEEEARMLTARQSGSVAGRTELEADAEIREAERDRDKAHEDVMAGVEGAEERKREAEERLTKARLKKVQGNLDGAAATRVVRKAQQRIDAVRENCLSELVEHIEREHREEFEREREALLSRLTDYVSRWSQYGAQYRPLVRAVFSNTQRREEDAGLFRADRPIQRDSQPPTCPISREVIEAVRALTPRPPALAADYQPRPGLGPYIDIGEITSATAEE